MASLIIRGCGASLEHYSTCEALGLKEERLDQEMVTNRVEV